MAKALWLVASVCVLWLFSVPVSHGWGSNKDKVLLKDISVLTLEQGRTTKGRRSSPIQQLTCKPSGSAGCPHSHAPRSAQCYNRGWDGNDVQWECKADMDSAYKFGRISVSCEGYDYPEDKYILKGSCGLEYEIDYTGSQGQQQQGGYGGGYQHQHQHQHHGGQQYGSSRGVLADNSWMILAVVGIVLFALYRWRRMSEDEADESGNDDGRAPPPGGQPLGGQPPSYDQSQSHHHKHQPQQHQQQQPQQQQPQQQQQHQQSRNATGAAAGGGLGGFFGGAATGGLLGYFLGGRNRTQYGHHHRPHNTGWGSGWGGGWGGRGSGWGSGGASSWGGGGGSSWGGGGGSSWGGGGGSSWGGSSHRSTSSGSSRTTSGFGSTSRR